MNISTERFSSFSLESRASFPPTIASRSSTPVHRKWFEEEVNYIITDQEREVFLSLPTVDDRARFVEAFWERRDPDPASPANEFKEEHYKRLEYANRIFSRDAPRPGWKTDMGHFWIVLGKPHEIQRFDGLNEVVATEVWYYNGDTKLGQPPRFNLVFFKPQDIGEYELYSPMGDGPEALLRAGSGPGYRTNQNLAVDALEIVSMDLARASLTVDLTEPVGSFLAGRNTRQPITTFVRVPMNVENVLANIEESRRRGVDTDYLDGYLRYKDKVTADYSFRFVPSRRYVRRLHRPGEDSLRPLRRRARSRELLAPGERRRHRVLHHAGSDGRGPGRERQAGRGLGKHSLRGAEQEPDAVGRRSALRLP